MAKIRTTTSSAGKRHGKDHSWSKSKIPPISPVKTRLRSKQLALNFPVVKVCNSKHKSLNKEIKCERESESQQSRAHETLDLDVDSLFKVIGENLVSKRPIKTEASEIVNPLEKDNLENIDEKKSKRIRKRNQTKEVEEILNDIEIESEQVVVEDNVEKEIHVVSDSELQDEQITEKNPATKSPPSSQENKATKEKFPELPASLASAIAEADLQAARRKTYESLITETNTTEVFVPEVVIWGEQIKQTIREVGNFFIVGAKESTRNNQSSAAEVKKVTNKPYTRRRNKQKSVQLMTLDEHKKILQACLKAGAGRGCCGDFKVDSLFRRGMDRRNSVYVDTVETEDGPMVLETSADPNSFTIGFEDGHIVIDDVANYECVESSGGGRGRSCGGSMLKSCSECDHRRKRAPKIVLGEDGTWDPQCDEHGKPRCTYTDLIERALTENPEGLTVSEIYNWISTQFPYYSPSDDRWKNSVRHNLSINPYFKKGSKSKNGAGHVWKIAEECQYFRPALKRRNVGSLDMSKMKTDTERAVASILGQYSKACEDESLAQEVPDSEEMNYCSNDAQEPSSPPNFENAAAIHDQQCSANHLSTIDVSDLNSVMQSTCLLQMEEFTRNGQILYVSQPANEGDESNKENLEETAPVEYTILETFDAGLMTQNGLNTPHTLSLTALDTTLSSEAMREMGLNTSVSSMDIFDSNELGLSMSFNFDSQGVIP